MRIHVPSCTKLAAKLSSASTRRLSTSERPALGGAGQDCAPAGVSQGRLPADEPQPPPVPVSADGSSRSRPETAQFFRRAVLGQADGHRTPTPTAPALTGPAVGPADTGLRRPLDNDSSPHRPFRIHFIGGAWNSKRSGFFPGHRKPGDASQQKPRCSGKGGGWGHTARGKWLPSPRAHRASTQGVAGPRAPGRTRTTPRPRRHRYTDRRSLSPERRSGHCEHPEGLGGGGLSGDTG